MRVDPETLRAILQIEREDEHLECKEAKTRFDSEKLLRYCAALANECGGKLVLGVTNTRPRKVVGTQVFQDLEERKRVILEQLRFRVDIEEINRPDGRVLIFHIPSRPLGVAVQYKGQYLMRSGESTVPMTPEILKRIFDETGPDFSAEMCHEASIDDLSPRAIAQFRRMWFRKSGNRRLLKVSDRQLLEDSELTIEGRPTYAALVLLGAPKALGRYVAQAEVIFEYRSGEASLSAQKRIEYRRGFFLFHNDLWKTIDLRNDIQQFQDGLFRWDIATFNESVVREAILNAVCHRDYRLGDSVFVRQYPKKLGIESPGGFIAGITPENILWRQAWRNRRIAEVMAKCGLVERSGQGADRMFELCIKESKATPDFTGSDEYRVCLTLQGEIQDVRFLKFLEHLGHEKVSSFGIEDLLVLNSLQQEAPMPSYLRSRLPYLKDQGVIERIGSGRGTTYILSRALYEFLGKKGVYTRKRGLGRETNKALLLEHIRRYRRSGSRFQELAEVLPSLRRNQVKSLLRELQAEGRISHTGRTKGSRWYPAAGADQS